MSARTPAQTGARPRADTFHKPGFKMHVKILHHLFGVVSGDVIKAPLWDVGALGPAAYPSNAAFVHAHVTQLLATSFPNMRPQQVEVRAPAAAPAAPDQALDRPHQDAPSLSHGSCLRRAVCLVRVTPRAPREQCVVMLSPTEACWRGLRAHREQPSVVPRKQRLLSSVSQTGSAVYTRDTL